MTSVAQVRLLPDVHVARVSVDLAGPVTSARDLLLCVRLFGRGAEIPVEEYNWYYSTTLECKFTYLELQQASTFEAPPIESGAPFDEVLLSIVPWSRAARAAHQDPAEGATVRLATTTSVLQGAQERLAVSSLSASSFEKER
ncbi:hypothetical protein [Serinicoccus marinus]|uniref:hypothetical protein n=1 Tax=Serinicoccus marinus TaxID=247333 RepID=UPI00248FF768|nr:hypothetical protein [Serinicoccus marinus]